jgi:hypothetical protein
MPAKEIVSTTPDILRSVIKMDRFNVGTGPTGIMGIVAMSSPNRMSLTLYEIAFPENGT